MKKYNLKFNTKRKVQTTKGWFAVCDAHPTQEFWRAWKNDKEEIKRNGFSVSKHANQFVVSFWEKLKQTRQDKIPREKKIPAPSGYKYLPYQIEGINSVARKRYALLADEMGLGKTIQAIGVANLRGHRQMIVICPASLKRNWEAELRQWLVADLSIGVAIGKNFPNTDVVVVNYDIVAKNRKSIDSRDWDFCVIDEVHYVKNPKAKRTQAVLGGGKTQAIRAKQYLALSGTPITNRPVEFWPLLRVFDSTGLGRNWKDYVNRYCGAKLQRVVGRLVWDTSGATNLDELQCRLRSRIMVRRKKQDVLPDLPAKRRQIIEIDGASRELFDASGRIEKQALEHARQNATVTKGLDELALVANSLQSAKSVDFENISRLRKQLAIEKIPFVIEHLETVLQNEPALLHLWHKDVVHAIAKHFGNRCTVMTGETPMDERQRRVDDFQAGKYDLFVSSIKEGYTLTRASTVVFGEGLWVPAEQLQFEDRLHRIGQTNRVLVQLLVFSQTLDSLMAKVVSKKCQILERALG